MTIISTQTNDAGVVQRAVGRYLTDETAAEFDITTGFKPRHVRVINVTARTMIEWFEGMADASAILTVAAGTRTLITTLGITALENGFTVGLQLDVNAKDEQISWICFG